MSRDYLYRREPLTDADLEQAERDALCGDSLQHQTAARLLVEVRRLRHELADPMYQYAGGRIGRHAIVCREARIEELRKDESRVSWLERQVRPVLPAAFADTTLSGLNQDGDVSIAVKAAGKWQGREPTLRAAIDAAMAANKGT